MKLIEKPFIVGGAQIGTYNAYTEIESELDNPQPRERVLPAPFFYEKRLFFFMIKKHEPGEKFWPKGGYEVRDEGGAIRCFDLDQIIIHPAVLKHRKVFNKMKSKAEKEQQKRIREYEKQMAKAKSKRGRPPGINPPKPKVPKGKRGRPCLNPEAKALREAQKSMQPKGKRGRPCKLR